LICIKPAETALTLFRLQALAPLDYRQPATA